MSLVYEKSPLVLKRMTEYALYALILVIPFSKALIEVCSAIMIVSWFLQKIVLYKWAIHKYLPRNAYLLHMSILVLSFIVSSLLGIHPLHSIESMVSKYCEYFMLYIIVVDMFSRKENNIIRIFYCQVISALVMCVDALYQFLYGIDFIRHYHLHAGVNVNGPLYNPNDLAAWIVIVMFLFHGHYLSQKARMNFIKILLVVLFVVLFFLLLQTDSNGAWLGCILALFVYGLYGTHQLQRKSKILGNAVIWLIVLSIIGFLIYTSIYIIPHVPVTIGSGRLRLWSDALEIVRDYPVWGSGVNTYLSILPRYSDLIMYPHNSYLHILAECGIIGIVLFLSLIVRMIVKMFRALCAQWNPILLGVMLGLSGFSFHAFFDTNLFNIQLVIMYWIYMGVGIALSNTPLKKQ